MATAIILILLIVVVVLGIRSYLKRLSGGGCCGGGDAPKRKKVADRNKANYPYTVTLEVGGMHCANCAVRVENALNDLDGVWATVDLDKKRAVVRMKQEIPSSTLCSTVARVGYTACVAQ